MKRHTSKQLAKHIKEFYHGGNWTSVSLKSALKGVTWKEAIHKVESFNSIASLVYHIHYYVHEVGKVLDGLDLKAKDDLSHNLPEINSKSDWDAFLAQVWVAGDRLSSLVEKMDDEGLYVDFTEIKYGNYFRNLLGVIEHSHYHLGQIAVLKKLQRLQ